MLSRGEQERYVRLFDEHPEWAETVERLAGKPVAAMTFQEKVFAVAELLKDDQLAAALSAKARVAAKAPELLVNELLTRLSRQPAAEDPPELQALLCDPVDVVRTVGRPGRSAPPHPVASPDEPERSHSPR